MSRGWERTVKWNKCLGGKVLEEKKFFKCGKKWK